MCPECKPVLLYKLQALKILRWCVRHSQQQLSNQTDVLQTMPMKRVVVRLDFKDRADSEVNVLAATAQELLQAANTSGWGSAGAIWTQSGQQLQADEDLVAAQLYTFSPLTMRFKTEGRAEVSVIAKTAAELVYAAIKLGWKTGSRSQAFGVISYEQGAYLCPSAGLEPRHLYTYHQPQAAGPSTKKGLPNEESQPPMKVTPMQTGAQSLWPFRIHKQQEHMLRSVVQLLVFLVCGG